MRPVSQKWTPFGPLATPLGKQWVPFWVHGIGSGMAQGVSKGAGDISQSEVGQSAEGPGGRAAAEGPWAHIAHGAHEANFLNMYSLSDLNSAKYWGVVLASDLTCTSTLRRLYTLSAG